MWQTDFTWLKVIAWGWFNLSTILDDYSRYVIVWKLRSNMRAEDVTDTLDIALAASSCNSAKVLHKARLPSDDGSSCIATGRPIALALVEGGQDRMGKIVHIPMPGRTIAARIIGMVLVDPGNTRLKI